MPSVRSADAPELDGLLQKRIRREGEALLLPVHLLVDPLPHYVLDQVLWVGSHRKRDREREKVRPKESGSAKKERARQTRDRGAPAGSSRARG